ncbi:3',5'-cyclic-AMP phosphodiesterase [Methylomonas rapida]|uniref:3',5'-cyclic-AMP phosphodiesterase n=1 Tax=Methylomonas rapida TaxID=2963939 RepID=A0ABY7GMQ8_9GAMM|nr:3',5'-cyclic-AMP phosphodiesterase [Methylomonas rapida]WAR45789.1 3',5'-cyclic-AMP phosphodiesterase [Methylomonas rapida]
MSVLKVLQITDLHVKPHVGDTMLGIVTEDYFQQTLKVAIERHGRFDLILVTGDLAQDPCPESYQRIGRHLMQYDTPCLCLPGNHDDFDMMKRYLNGGLVSCRQQWIAKNWRIIALNSQKPGSPQGELTTEELRFLEETLRKEPSRPALIAVHHHCIPSGSPWLDTMQIQNSGEFLSLVKTFPNVKAVTFGHVHQELSATMDKIAIFATPASCFQFTPHSMEFSIDDAPPGYRIFDLFADGSLKSECHRLPIRLEHLNRQAHEY